MAMADVKLACGACGTAVEPGSKSCSSCGALLRYPAFRTAEEIRCPACGYAQEGGEGVCVSCGASLRPGKMEKERPRPSGGKKAHGGGKAGTEPWMVVAGVSVLILLAYIVYTTVTAPPATGPMSATGVAAGPSAGPVAPPVAAPRPDLGPLEEAVKRNPKDPAALLQLANALHDVGLWERAIGTYGQYLAGTPGNPDARVDMAICYFEASKANAAKREEYRGRAVTEMKKVLTDHPRHQPAAFNLGVVILQTGDVAGANEWFTRAAEIDPASPLGQRATSLLQQHTFTN